MKVNPCKGIKVLVKKGRRKRFLTDSEISSVLATFPKLTDDKAADVYTLILASMCRPGEAAGIQAEDIVALNGERVWKLTDPKNGQDFLIPLFGPIGEVIAAASPRSAARARCSGTPGETTTRRR